MAPPPEHMEAHAALGAADQQRWDAYRVAHPARFAAQPLAGQAEPRPGKSGQNDWNVYTGMLPGSSTRINQQHLVVPFLVSQPLAGTQPIDGNPETEPKKLGHRWST